MERWGLERLRSPKSCAHDRDVCEGRGARRMVFIRRAFYMPRAPTSTFVPCSGLKRLRPQGIRMDFNIAAQS
eukprot:scaffold243179_cov30-Tisochrysis_lutea.AAC.1